VFAFYWRSLRWYHMAAAMLYVANLDVHRPWILGHLWSLSIEEQFYLVWPGVLKSMVCAADEDPAGRVRVAHRFPRLFSTCSGCRSRRRRRSPPSPTTWPPVACWQFSLPALPRIPAYAFGAMVAGIVLVPLFQATSSWRTLFDLFLLRPLLYFSMAGVVLQVVQSPYRALNWGPVVWLGKISYSLYLWQQPFCVDPALRSWSLVPLVLVFACLSYYLVEVPVLRLREKQVPSARKEKEPLSVSGTSALPQRDRSKASSVKPELGR
jgi:peptidoglycan/LPS O-acetylase OafA/YrhL